MKSLFLSLVILCGITVVGCAPSKENKLATDGTTADEFAKYEAELAAVSGGDSYTDAEDADDEDVDAGAE